MFTKDNLPQLDKTMGQVLKTRPMLAVLLLADRVIPAPWGGELTGIAGVDAYMVQALDNGKGRVDGYFNKVSQMFADYHVVGPKNEKGIEKRADELTDEELATIFEDLPARLAHVRELFGADAKVFIMQRTKANQTLLGRAQESGTFETHEGPVDFDVGAYINQDARGRTWPIDQETFERDYQIL